MTSPHLYEIFIGHALVRYGTRQRSAFTLEKRYILAKPSISDDAKVFMATLRKLRERVGNGFLRHSLGWREERYWRVHESLLERGKIVRGRGRGGSVGLS